MNRITIAIMGQANSGKTTLALALQEFLRSQGLSVSVHDEDTRMYGESRYAQHQDRRLKALADADRSLTHVRIETYQVQRPGRPR